MEYMKYDESVLWQNAFEMLSSTNQAEPFDEIYFSFLTFLSPMLMVNGIAHRQRIEWQIQRKCDLLVFF